MRSGHRLYGRSSVAALGYAVVMLAAATAPAQTSKPLVYCMKRISYETLSMYRWTVFQTQRCTEKIVACKLDAEINGSNPSSCLDSAMAVCTKSRTILDKDEQRRKDSLARRCEQVLGLPLDALKPYVGGPGFVDTIATCGSTITGDFTSCLIDRVRCQGERAALIIDPRAADSLETLGLLSFFPCVAPPP